MTKKIGCILLLLIWIAYRVVPTGIIFVVMVARYDVVPWVAIFPSVILGYLCGMFLELMVGLVAGGKNPD